MSNKQKKKSKAEAKPKKEEKELFDITEAEKIVNPMLLPGFKQFIRGKKVQNMQEYTKLYDNYKEMKL